MARPIGAKGNKSNELKNMIIASFLDDRVGGIDYLVKQATENPTAYLGLIGKVLPKEVEMEIRQSAIEQIAHGILEHEPLTDCTEAEGRLPVLCQPSIAYQGERWENHPIPVEQSADIPATEG